MEKVVIRHSSFQKTLQHIVEILTVPYSLSVITKNLLVYMIMEINVTTGNITIDDTTISYFLEQLNISKYTLTDSLRTLKKVNLIIKRSKGVYIINQQLLCDFRDLQYTNSITFKYLMK